MPLARPLRRLGLLVRADRATSDVEYILLTAFVIMPLMAVPPMIMAANRTWFERLSFWVNLPFP